LITGSVSFEGLKVTDKGPATITLDKEILKIRAQGDITREYVPKEAMIEVQKKFKQNVLWWGIGLFFVAGIGVILIILYYYVKAEVLVIHSEDGREIVVSGKKDKLYDLHYLIQKRCLKKRNTGSKRRTRQEKKIVKGEKPTRMALTCPQCGSDDITFEAALYTGRKYHCKNCDYVGAFVIEKDVFQDRN